MKYSGKIGFWKDDIPLRPGVTVSDIVERPYSGDITRNTQRWNRGENSANDDITINNRISIIADVYLQQNFSSIKYVTFMGTKWKVNSIEIQYPRVLIEIGGVWNGVDGKQET